MQESFVATPRNVVLITGGDENRRATDSELFNIIGRKDNNFMGCKMVFRRIMMLMLFWAWLQPVGAAERSRLIDDERSSSNYTQGSASMPDPDDGNDDDYTTQGVECYQAMPVKAGKFIQYTFWDHIVVNTRYTESRCIILNDVPFSGFYNIEVYAGYSVWEGPEEKKEEYRLVINLGDTLVVGPVIPDQFDGLLPKSTDKYVWKWNPHGYQYLRKGDNLIYFTKGNQVDYSNSVDLRGIRLIPPPHIIEEPPFTRGAINTVRWMPIDDGDYTQEVFYFDTSAPSPGSPEQQLMLSKGIPSQYKDAFFSGLEDGHRYGYYVETFLTPDQPIYSDTTYSTQDASPPGQVHIDSLSAFANRRVQLFWNSVADAVSGVKRYEVLRFSGGLGISLVDTVARVAVDAACTLAEKYDYCISDLLPADAALTREYRYRIDAVDNVANRSTGILSELVLGIPGPKIEVIPAPAFARFHKGAIVTVGVDISSLQLPESHFVKFQAARDSVKYLDDEWQLNKYFFDSGWLPVKQTPKIQQYTFDLSNGGKEKLSFIDGHRYHVRAQYKDLQGNLSPWSTSSENDKELTWVTPDCYPADDITFLTVTPVTNEAKTQGWLELNWGGAVDRTSGIDSFLVYRKIDKIESTFSLIAKSKGTTYRDSYEEIAHNGSISYCIGSDDRAGNRRTFEQTNYTVTAKSQTAPEVELLAKAEETINGIKYTTIEDAFLFIKFTHFDEHNNVKIVALVNATEVEPKPVINVDNLYSLMLPGQGNNVIRVKAVFPNKSETIWCKPDSINYVDELPSSDGVQSIGNELAAGNYPNPFNMTTSITFYLDSPAHVTVNIYNVQGRLIRALLDEERHQGMQAVPWNGENHAGLEVASGIYYYQIRIEGENGRRESRLQRMLLVK